MSEDLLDVDEDSEEDESEGFDPAGFIDSNKPAVVLLVVGIVFIAIGAIYSSGIFTGKSEIEILGSTSGDSNKSLIVEVSGAVNSPGVFEFDTGKRVEDALLKAGGINENADFDWIEKVLNRAATLEDGQKIYIPRKDENKQSDVLSARGDGGYQNVSTADFAKTEEKVNINKSSAPELESLWGIGRITAQNIIEQRPYSKIEELLERGILKKNVYERNKERLTVY